MKKNLPVAVLFILSLGAISAFSQCRVAGNIAFRHGSTGASVSGRVSSARSVCYKFRARAGQTLSATLTSTSGHALFSIGTDTADVDDDVTGDTTSWTGTLTGDYGNAYLVSIHVPRGTTAFTLSVDIK